MSCTAPSTRSDHTDLQRRDRASLYGWLRRVSRRGRYVLGTRLRGRSAPGHCLRGAAQVAVRQLPGNRPLPLRSSADAAEGHRRRLATHPVAGSRGHYCANPFYDQGATSLAAVTTGTCSKDWRSWTAPDIGPSSRVETNSSKVPCDGERIRTRGRMHCDAGGTPAHRFDRQSSSRDVVSIVPARMVRIVAPRACRASRICASNCTNSRSCTASSSYSVKT